MPSAAARKVDSSDFKRLPQIPKKGNAFSESTVTAIGLKSVTSLD